MKTNWPALKYGCLILASLALATKPAPAQTPGATGAGKSAAVISSVAITQAPERSAVRVEGEGKLEVRAARMQHPDRLVLDFVGARLAVHKTVIPGVSAPVAAVRMAQYQPDVARVVVDLMGPTSYYVSRDSRVVLRHASTAHPSRHAGNDGLVDCPPRPYQVQDHAIRALPPRRPHVETACPL